MKNGEFVNRGKGLHNIKKRRNVDKQYCQLDSRRESCGRDDAQKKHVSWAGRRKAQKKSHDKAYACRGSLTRYCGKRTAPGR